MQETLTPWFAHTSAIVDDGAEIGHGTRIWHFSHVMSGARIGRDCVLGQNVFVGATARLGNRVKVQNNVSIYDAVVLEDEVFCGPSMVFTNVVNPRAAIERKTEYRSTVVRRGATIGAAAVIVCGCEIGAFAFVGAGAVVTRDVAPFALVYGNPARRKGWMCRCGVQLDAADPGELECPACASRYRADGESLRASDEKDPADPQSTHST